MRGTLRGWLEVYGTGKKTAADGTVTSQPAAAAVRVAEELLAAG